MKINHRHYILLIFAFSSITISIFGYIFIYGKTIAQAENYLSAKKEVESENSKNQYEQKLIETFNKYEEDRAKIDSYIIREDKIVDFIEQVEKIGPDSNTDLQISSIASADGKLKARVETLGTWQGVMNALMLIENMPFSISISNVRMDTSGEIESQVNKKVVQYRQWKLTLDIEALTIK